MRTDSSTPINLTLCQSVSGHSLPMYIILKQDASSVCTPVYASTMGLPSIISTSIGIHHSAWVDNSGYSKELTLCSSCLAFKIRIDTKYLLLTNHLNNLDPKQIVKKINVHSFVDYMKLETVGPNDYFFRFEYEIGSGWLSPAVIAMFCKCLLPFNPDMFTLMCEACKERYHPDCIKMTLDEAKQLADNFTCSDCLAPDNQGCASAASATVDRGTQVGKEMISRLSCVSGVVIVSDGIIYVPDLVVYLSGFKDHGIDCGLVVRI
ncbi:chromatin remodeling protein EBS [Artemisia annua]|uniref:Chromatin remodeling protein EBS n=1 Tax=Artemisia annua TaxID=35608 RepID=A0A2U1ND74_ARTAN|nr:chromatin remodeling protein EBS [Artemisia annua]